MFQAYGEPTDGQWQKVALSFELPPGAKHINLELFNFFAQGVVWWDDVSLRFDAAEVQRREEHRRAEAERAKQAAAMIGEIAAAVEKLPDTAAEQKLKKAVLSVGNRRRAGIARCRARHLGQGCAR